MPTAIANLWTPNIWIPAVRERAVTAPVIFNSGAVVKSPQFDTIASGGGILVEVPMWKDISDQDDEVQVESTGPVNNLGITAGTMRAPIMNRVTKNSAEALAAAVSGGDPVGEMTGQIGLRRAKQRNKTLIGLLRGAFGTSPGAALGNAAILAGVRRSVAIEAGATATSVNLLSGDVFSDGKALLGEQADTLINGALFMHPNVRASLEKQDRGSFKTGIESGLPFTVETYRGVPVFTHEALVRAGTTSGFVYDSYLLTSGILAYGEKPQTADTGDTIDIAALQFDSDKDKNTSLIYDRTRFMFHLNGLRWVGSPAGSSATNAELGALANWQLIYSTANRVGAVCFVTNG